MKIEPIDSKMDQSKIVKAGTGPMSIRCDRVVSGISIPKPVAPMTKTKVKTPKNMKNLIINLKDLQIDKQEDQKDYLKKLVKV